MLIKKDQNIIKGYFEDSSNLKGGHAEEVVIPEDIEELSSVIRQANSKKTPVTISGGGTATTGSRIPFGGIVVSTERLNKILGISQDRLSGTVEAGVPVEELKSICEKEGLFYTSHPTEKSAYVGSTIATNASGARSYKYGPTRKYVRGLKMVMADGEIFDIKRGERFLTRSYSRIKTPSGRQINIPLPGYKMPAVKSSAGYFAKDGMDLIDLFIGQEGTLSVIASAEIGFVKKAENIFSLFVFFHNEEDSWDFTRDIKVSLDALSIEYFGEQALGLLREKNSNIPLWAKAAIFFEVETSASDEDKVTEACTDLVKKHNVRDDDVWAAPREESAEEFTKLRYSIPESINEITKRSGFRKIATDIAVPAGKFLEMARYYRDSFKNNKFNHFIFGHIGESHVHVNILPRSDEEFKKAIDLSVDFIRKGVSLGGTAAAEHGIGKIKHKYLELMYGKRGVAEMALIKKALDPNCILGLDNIFSKELLKEL